jgi:hypothetical protein
LRFAHGLASPRPYGFEVDGGKGGGAALPRQLGLAPRIQSEPGPQVRGEALKLGDEAETGAFVPIAVEEPCCEVIGHEQAASLGPGPRPHCLGMAGEVGAVGEEA